MTNKPAIVATASCPFCKGKVADDVLQFGGNCPHCLLEIPGEEAPTDPGLIARKKLEAEALLKARALKKTRVKWGVLVALASCVGIGILAWNAEQDKEARTYELPDDLYLPPLQEAAAPGVTPAATPTPGQAVPTPRHPGMPAVNPANPLATLANSAPAPIGAMPDIASNTPAPVAPPTLSGPKHSTADAATDVQVAMSGSPSASEDIADVPIPAMGSAVLTSDDEILGMIKEVTSRYTPQVRACYESRLKLNENLAGAWSLSFVVKKDGSTASVAVTPQGRKDADLESCIAKTVGAWKFSRIARDQPVTKTERFGAAGF